MKIVKKIGKILLILLLVATYFNIGYWGGKSWADATIRFYKNEPLNGFQKFQLGGWKALRLYNNTNDFENDFDKLQKALKWRNKFSVLAWPGGLVAALTTWVIYGIVQAAIAIWSAIVFLVKFFFCGGFFKLLGIVN